MPNPKFCLFVANFGNALVVKKLHFVAPKTCMNEKFVEILQGDGFISSYYVYNKGMFIKIPKVDIMKFYGFIYLYSTPKGQIIITRENLIGLGLTGGYFILSTIYGIINDAKADQLKIGGTLLFAIF